MRSLQALAHWWSMADASMFFNYSFGGRTLNRTMGRLALEITARWLFLLRRRIRASDVH
jgi:hypothetical protein